MERQGQILKGRQILIDIEIDWEDKVPAYQGKNRCQKPTGHSTTNHRKGYRKVFK